MNRSASLACQYGKPIQPRCSIGRQPDQVFQINWSQLEKQYGTPQSGRSGLDDRRGGGLHRSGHLLQGGIG
jgi:hypothetical protein